MTADELKAIAADLDPECGALQRAADTGEFAGPMSTLHDHCRALLAEVARLAAERDDLRKVCEPLMSGGSVGSAAKWDAACRRARALLAGEAPPC